MSPLATATVVAAFASVWCAVVAAQPVVAPGAASHGVLDVEHLSADGMRATFTNADSHVHITTTTGSMNISAAGQDGCPFLFAQRRQLLHDLDVVVTTVMDKSFVSLTSAQGNTIVLEATGSSETTLKKMFHEHPEVKERTQAAYNAQRVAVADMFEQRSDEIKALIDGGLSAGSFENLFSQLGISGKTHPHVLPFFVMAKHAADELGYEPVTDVVIKSGNVAHRSLQGDATHWMDGSCKRPPQTSACIGMCGPGCSCWSSWCGDCCYHQLCADHDNCEGYSFWTGTHQFLYSQCDSRYRCGSGGH
jgi:hypothetical protein